MNTEKGQQLYRRAKEIIPGGTQLLSKRPELYAPGLWPPYAADAQGCRIRDLDGNEFIDISTMGIGTCILGYADTAVNRAVEEAVHRGSMCSLNFAEEVELAELLVELHPWAEMVRFARTGGEVLAVAVRIARAATRRDRVAFCGYHGWNDWYLASNLGADDALDGHLLPGLDPLGVPRGLRETAIPFHYNDIDAFRNLLDTYSDIGTVIMEPVRYAEPEAGFLEDIRELTRRRGIVLIFDEVTAGWRHTVGGSGALYGIEPDMAVYAKAMGNGYPCAAVVGRGTVMDAAQSSFISSTYWTERVGFAAAVATLKEFRDRHVPEVLRAAGSRIQAVWRSVSEETGLPVVIEGRPALTHFTFSHPQAAVLATLLTQKLLERGYLGTTACYVSCAHTPEVIDGYGSALREVFAELRTAAESSDPSAYLQGPAALKGFTRLT